MSEEKKTDIDQSEESQENLESSASEAVDVEIVSSEEEEAADEPAVSAVRAKSIEDARRRSPDPQS